MHGQLDRTVIGQILLPFNCLSDQGDQSGIPDSARIGKTFDHQGGIEPIMFENRLSGSTVTNFKPGSILIFSVQSI